MGSDKRTTLPRRKAYHTKSNRMQVVKTPGGKLVMHVVKKRSSGPKCGDTGVQLHGVRPTFTTAESSPVIVPGCGCGLPMRLFASLGYEKRASRMLYAAVEIEVARVYFGGSSETLRGYVSTLC